MKRGKDARNTQRTTGSWMIEQQDADSSGWLILKL